jgi:hypothetical protein
MFSTHRHGHLTVVSAPVSKVTVRLALALGRARTIIDERILRWSYRHHGMNSDRAHAVGLLGEMIFAAWLEAQGLREPRDFRMGDIVVTRLEDIGQDFVVLGSQVGVKSALARSLDEALAHPGFLYPAKDTPGEAQRHVGIPDFVVQTVVVLGDAPACHLCGAVARHHILTSPIVILHGKPAHQIPHSHYQPLEIWIQEMLLKRGA